MPANVIIELAGLAFAFLFGLLVNRFVSLLSITVGLFINFVGELLINGGGPTFFVGLFIFPFMTLICGLSGKAIRDWFDPPKEREGKPPFCATCGYSLYTNFSERCPECGTPTTSFRSGKQ